MKYTITHIAEWVLIGIIMVLFLFTAYKTYQIKEKVEYITIQDTIKLNDTIVDMEYDTCYLFKKDTVKLPVVINDTTTLIKIDSILVEVPISATVYDTVIQDTSHKTHLKAVVSGFRCSLDTLCMDTEIIQQQPKKQPWYKRFAPSCGIGIGTGGQIGLFFGIGYTL